MVSVLWDWSPEEAFQKPYEYDTQRQFSEECRGFLRALLAELGKQNMSFGRDETTFEKAAWMLSLDLVDGLLELVQLVDEKRHRAASRMFRDAIETIDLLKVLNQKTDQAAEVLRSWYANDTLSHGKCRAILAGGYGESWKKDRSDYYYALSKFTHRTYRALLKSYILGGNDRLVFDGMRGGKELVLPHTISAYYAISASLVRQALEVLQECRMLPNSPVQPIWAVSSPDEAQRNPGPVDVQ
ncbi:hypothetical protein [Viridibacterium curvum]|uniref:Uncharacterized protein n=1 Tax=Viridibacterium curvum TaxID=1101404 RepID=A0ABP9QSL6_9RHOO